MQRGRIVILSNEQLPLVYCRVRKNQQTFDVDQFSLQDIQKKKNLST